MRSNELSNHISAALEPGSSSQKSVKKKSIVLSIASWLYLLSFIFLMLSLKNGYILIAAIPLLVSLILERQVKKGKSGSLEGSAASSTVNTNTRSPETGSSVTDASAVSETRSTASDAASETKSIIPKASAARTSAAGSSIAEWFTTPFYWYLLSVFLTITALMIQGNRQVVWFVSNLRGTYGTILVVLGIAGMAFYGTYLYQQGHPDKSSPKWMNWLILVVEALLCLYMAMVFYTSSFYPAGAKAQAIIDQKNAALDSGQNKPAEANSDPSNHEEKPEPANHDVVIKDIEGVRGSLFDGPGTQDALIFYPGAKVDPAAYAPLLEEIASDGVDVFLIDMPWNMAVFGMNAADSILESPDYSYDHYYIGGHSLGSAMASSYAAKHPELNGLLLLAGYATSPLPADIGVVSIYGSEDGVINRESLEKNAGNLPGDAMVIEMEGANHAGFADYGPQKGDHAATISPEKQQAQTAKAFLQMVQEQDSYRPIVSKM